MSSNRPASQVTGMGSRIHEVKPNSLGTISAPFVAANLQDPGPHRESGNPSD